MKPRFYRQIIESIVRIIEEKPLFEIPKSFYKAIIFLSFFQVGLYALEESDDHPITDSIVSPMYHILQMLSINRVLVLQNSSVLSGICLVVSQLFLYLYFLYVTFFSVLKYYFQSTFQRLRNSFTNINRFLNMYFCLFLSIFLNYQAELSASVISCSPKSLFKLDRQNYDQGTCSIEPWQIIIGVGGVIMSSLTAIICLLFFRNFKFNESNLMKRRVSILFMLSTFLKILITFIEHSSMNSQKSVIAKHILLHIFGITSLLDAILNNPYSENEISIFNLTIASNFYCLIATCSVWVLSSHVPDGIIFYAYLVLSLVLSGFFKSINKLSYERCLEEDIVLKLSKGEADQNFPFDFYLQEWIRIGELSNKSELDKYKIQKIFSIHQSSCIIEYCPCQDYQKHQSDNKTSFGQKRISILESDGKQVNFKIVQGMVDSLFKWFLEQKSISSKQREYEHLSMKYITFMIECLKNPVRANYELKSLMHRRSVRDNRFSLYFQIVSQILSENMQKEIEKMNENIITSKRKEELTIHHISISDSLSQEFIPIFQEVLSAKSLMWTQLQNGYKNMNEFQKDVLKLMHKIDIIRKNFMQKMSITTKKMNFDYCLSLKKLNLLFYLFVMNDTVQAFQLEQDSEDLRKRDAFLEEDCLNNENMIKKNTIQLILSISSQIGQITSKKDLKTAEFFGFSLQEFQKIQKVNELMPPFFAQQHDFFIKTFLRRGTSKIIKSGFATFAKNNGGYLIPIKLHPDFIFLKQDDFFLQGTLLKIDKGADYVIFDRFGNILGLSQNFAQLLVVSTNIQNQLPSAEWLSKQLQAYILIPNLIKKLHPKREEILQNIQSVVSEIIASEENGKIEFDSKLFQSVKNFLKQIINEPANRNLHQKQDLINVSEADKSLDELDVLSKDSFQKYKSFKKKQSQISQNLGSNTRSTTMVTKSSASVLTSNNLISKYKQKPDNEETNFLLSFKYQLSYISLPSTTSQLGESLKEKKVYFTLKMQDLSLSHKSKTKKNLLKHSSFITRLAYLMNRTTCLPAISTLIQPVLNNENTSAREDDDQIHFDSFRIPKNLLHFLFNKNQTERLLSSVSAQPNEDSNFQGNESRQSKEIEKSMLYSSVVFNKATSKLSSLIKTKEMQEERQEEDEEEKERAFTNQLSESSSEEETQENAYDKQEYFYSPSKMKQIDTWFAQINSSNIDLLFQQHNIEAQDLENIDPSYKIKRIICNLISSSKFLTTLEKGIAQALLELQEHPSSIIQEEEESSKIKENEQEQDEEQKEVQKLLNPKQLEEHQNEEQSLVHSYVNSKKQNENESQENSEGSITFRQNKQNNQYIHSFVSEKHQLPNHRESDNYSSFRLSPKDSFKPQIHQVQKQDEVQNLKTNNSEKQMNNSFFGEIHSEQQDFHQTSFRKQLSQSTFRNAQHLEASQENLKQTNNASFLLSTPNQHDYQLTVEAPLADNYNLNDTGKDSKISKQVKFDHSQKPKKKKFKTPKEQSFLKFQSGDDFKRSLSQIEGQRKIHANQSGEGHERAMAELLNQGGIPEAKGQEQNSVHSSSKSSTSYGGYFLKEIIQQCKVPFGAHNYTSILLIFAIVFVGLNIANFLIIQNDMTQFSDNVIVLRQPRKLFRDYVKSLFGFYLQIQINSTLFKDTSTSSYFTYSRDYLINATRSYNSIIEQFHLPLIQYTQQLQNFDGEYFINYTNYNMFNSFLSMKDTSQILEHNVNFLIGLQSNQTQEVQINSYMTLRSNFINYSKFIIKLIEFLVTQILETADSLILKFTIICIGAIGSLLAMTFISFPIAKNINLYEEKILMVASRINLDQSQIEKQKLSIFSSLMTLETYDWLKFNFNEVFDLKFNQFNPSHFNSSQNLNDLKSFNRGQQNKSNKVQVIHLTLHDKSTNTRQDPSKFDANTSKFEENYFGEKDTEKLKQIDHQKGSHTMKQNQNLLPNQENKSNLTQTAIKQVPQGDNKQQPFKVKSNNENFHFKKNVKNYVLSTKIGNQRLSLIYKIWSLIVLSILSISYFLVIIVYLNINVTSLKTPVYNNRRTNLLHISAVLFKFSCELIAFDSQVSKVKWPKYSLIDYQQYSLLIPGYQANMNQFQSELTNIIYGESPYPDSITQILKDIIEGSFCSYITSYNCTNNKDNLLSTEGIKALLANYEKLSISYNSVLTSSQSTQEDLLEYLNSSDRIHSLVQGFRTPDQVFDIFSSSSNEAIGTVSLEIQTFLQNFLLICGYSLASVTIIVFFFSRKKLYQNIQLMNLFLTFIPEEKLQEEVTLHMVKQLLRM